MKYIYIIVSIFIISSFISCEQTSTNTNTKVVLNPPSWIQGIWVESGNKRTYEFTESDIIVTFTASSKKVSLSKTYINHKEITKTNNKYEIQFTDPSNNSTFIEAYEKKSNTELTIAYDGSVLSQTLTKQ